MPDHYLTAHIINADRQMKDLSKLLRPRTDEAQAEKIIEKINETIRSLYSAKAAAYKIIRGDNNASR